VKLTSSPVAAKGVARQGRGPVAKKVPTHTVKTRRRRTMSDSTLKGATVADVGIALGCKHPCERAVPV
jgi:hypothetical protein